MMSVSAKLRIVKYAIMTIASIVCALITLTIHVLAIVASDKRDA